jgi:hypothetical protein
VVFSLIPQTRFIRHLDVGYPLRLNEPDQLDVAKQYPESGYQPRCAYVEMGCRQLGSHLDRGEYRVHLSQRLDAWTSAKSDRTGADPHANMMTKQIHACRQGPRWDISINPKTIEAASRGRPCDRYYMRYLAEWKRKGHRQGQSPPSVL